MRQDQVPPPVLRLSKVSLQAVSVNTYYGNKKVLIENYSHQYQISLLFILMLSRISVSLDYCFWRTICISGRKQRKWTPQHPNHAWIPTLLAALDSWMQCWLSQWLAFFNMYYLFRQDLPSTSWEDTLLCAVRCKFCLWNIWFQGGRSTNQPTNKQTRNKCLSLWH